MLPVFSGLGLVVGCEIDRDRRRDSQLTHDSSNYRNIDAAIVAKSGSVTYLSRDFDQLGASGSDGVTRLDDELLVPAKPFGFLAAALNEYEPARPEVHRSRVRPDPRRSLLARVSFRGESLLRGEPVRGA